MLRISRDRLIGTVSPGLTYQGVRTVFQDAAGDDETQISTVLTRCMSKPDKFRGTLASSLSGLSLWPMSPARSVPKCVRQTLDGMRPVVTRKKGLYLLSKFENGEYTRDVSAYVGPV